jgi:membrane protein YdbS with pleckstrin-like domain
MDDSDADRAGDGPFDGELTPAVRRVDAGPGEGGGDGDGDGDGDATGSDVAADEAVPDVEDLVGPRRTLEPTVQAVWAIQSGITAAVLGTIAGVAFAFLPPAGAWVGGAVFTALFLLGVVFSVLRYRAWSYELRDDSLYLERGVVTRVRTVVPYVRIQHVDASRGPLERVFGLATTVVYTAGSRGADVSIPGLTPERANDQQTRLKQLAIAAEGEDAV